MESTAPHASSLARQSIALMPTRLQIERWAPTFVGAAVAVGWWFADGNIGQHYAKELMAALLSAAAISAGFLTTALSILLPLAAAPLGKRLKRSGYLPHLFSYLRWALYSCLALSGACVIAFFFVPEAGALPRAISTAIIFLSAFAAAALVRIAEVLINLFELASVPEDLDG